MAPKQQQLLGYNGAFDTQGVPPGVQGIRVVSDDDVLGLLRNWTPGDITVPGGHGPDLGIGVSTVFNALIHLIYVETEYPGLIGAAMGRPSLRGAAAVLGYVRVHIDPMAPDDQGPLLERVTGHLGAVLEGGWEP